MRSRVSSLAGLPFAKSLFCLYRRAVNPAKEQLPHHRSWFAAPLTLTIMQSCLWMLKWEGFLGDIRVRV